MNLRRHLTRVCLAVGSASSFLVSQSSIAQTPVMPAQPLPAVVQVNCESGLCEPCASVPQCDPCCTAAAGCELGDPWTLSEFLMGSESAITVGGWLSAGYHSDDNGLFNQHADRFHAHQAWLYIEKAADTETKDVDLGFRVDTMYGVDAGDTQAFGNNAGEWDFQNGFDHGIYGWALPQAYVEIAGSDVAIKAGHFYTLVGYEVVTAPDNFFYSHAMTMFNSEPFTHTGVLATLSLLEGLEGYAGWTLGWDTGFDQLGDGSSFLGGFSATLSDDITLTYILTAGDFGWRGSDGYSHSVVVDTTLTENLNYVLQSDSLRVASTGEDNIGINQYLFYTVNDCFSVGTRLEWWKADNVLAFAPFNASLPAAGSFSYYAATFGANVKPAANLTVRPEVRHNWSPAADYDETVFGIDAVVTF